MRLLRYFILATGLAFFGSSQATHIVGGELYYEYLGSDTYMIKLVVYRDCFKGIPGFDNPARVAIFDKSWNRIMNVNAIPAIPDTIPLENYDSCTWVDTVCYEIGVYEFQVVLPPIPGGYIIAYDRCCWNHSVLNIINPDESGITIVTQIPDTSIAAVNNGPYFVNRTPTFFCVNKDFEFDHMAIDPDGDSLVYELFTPWNSTRVWDSHLAPLPGPFKPLIYSAGYSLSNVLGSSIPLSIDKFTGKLTARLDNTIGQFVFGVRVKEYRDGVQIGYTERSYQINSQNCRRYTVAAFDNPIIQCGDSVVSFTNHSDSSMAYFWHFGDTSSPDSTSTGLTPTHTYSDFGKYKVQLVAYSYQGNSCNDTMLGSVELYEELVGEFAWQEETCSNFVLFSDSSIPAAGSVISWLWDFGDGTGASISNPYKHFNLTSEALTFKVVLKVSDEFGCEDTVVHYYTGIDKVYHAGEATASKSIVYPRLDSTLLHVDAGDAVSYLWRPDASLTSPAQSTTYAKPQAYTRYTVEVTDSRGCKDEKSIDVDVHEYACNEMTVYIPNAFSPNSDGENDYLRVRGEEIRRVRLSVFNRWGQLVYESTDVGMIEDASLGWDGSLEGVKQDPGVFIYKLSVECNNDYSFEKKGNVTLIR